MTNHFKSSKTLSDNKQESFLVFDLETVPQASLSNTQQLELMRKVERSKEFDKTTEENNVELIRKFQATSPYFGKIICIGIYFPTSEKKIALIGEEQVILERFWQFADSTLFTGTFVTYNGLDFDVPFILHRSMVHGIKPTHERFMDTGRYQKNGCHRDVYKMLTKYDPSAAITLDLACDIFNVPSPKNGPVRAATVYDYYLKGDINLIAEYCMKDVIATYQLYDKARYYCIN